MSTTTPQELDALRGVQWANASMSGVSPKAPEVVKTDRWFLRCSDCLTVLAIEHPRKVYDRTGYVLPPESIECGACGGKLEAMGRVARRGFVVGQTLEVPEGCDERCTFASGPKCECPCGAVHHGAGVLVTVDRTGKTPRATTLRHEEARARAAEYRAALEAALERIRPLGKADYDRKMSGAWLEGAAYGRAMDYLDLLLAVGHAKHLRTHKGRLARLAKIGAKPANEVRS